MPLCINTFVRWKFFNFQDTMYREAKFFAPRKSTWRAHTKKGIAPTRKKKKNPKLSVFFIIYIICVIIVFCVWWTDDLCVSEMRSLYPRTNFTSSRTLLWGYWNVYGVIFRFCAVLPFRKFQVFIKFLKCFFY